jgi:CRP-like cAMP-binding protein
MPTDVSKKVNDYFSKYPKRNYPKGQILVFADESPQHIFYIINGQVRKYDVSYRGEEVIINIFHPPAFFPMSWAINQTPNKYFYKTETEVDLHIIPAADALQFLKENADVTFDLLARLYAGLEGMYGRMVHLMSGTARSRVIYELVIESRRFGSEQADGSHILDATEVDLAARSGLSRETVSREMSKLKTSNWIHVTAKHLVVPDIAILEQALGLDE